ncbi:hypothetical protein D9613_005602 [Agrocybe pediades]|uniref:Uncharacterized protein n=1 Tax=Agrocybe pediades TaxID=84607 RepID=A0A8H4VRB5_9AGAR|nr:hypothetical protein D9613_005602 [Agrocybe pediades]
MFSARILAARTISRLSTQRSTQTILPSRLRLFSTTPSRHATEKPTNQALASALENSAAYKKIMQSQEALDALKELAQIFQQSGIDMSAGKPPSMLQMSKLLLKSEFREASTKVMTEFQKAGVDLKDKQTLEELQALMAKAGFKPQE